MKLIFAILVFVLATLIQAQTTHDPNYCYASDAIKPQRSRWSGRTSNDWVRAQSINAQASRCVPARMWVLMRRGDALPNAGNIDLMSTFSTTAHTNIVNSINAGRSRLCPQDADSIVNWRWDTNITAENEQFLTVSGWNTVSSLARRLQRAFPTLLSSTYTEDRFLFRHTYRQRSQATLRAFADGLFGENAYRNVRFPEPPTPDYFLRPYTDCDLYDQADMNTVERDAWENSTAYRTTVDQINDKLGLTGAQRLSLRQARTIWEICQYHQLWFPDVDGPYCGAISPFNSMHFEYFDELNVYHRSGYGLNPGRLAENLNCPLLSNLLQYLSSQNPFDQTARIFASHTTTLQLFLTSLGVFRDAEPFTASNFEQQMNRNWVLSRLTPAASNLVAVRYNCAGENNDDVLFLLNEHPLVLPIPGCLSNGLCKVRDVDAALRRFAFANCAQLSCSTL